MAGLYVSGQESMGYSQFVKGQGFLILQLLLYAWYTVRKAPVLRIPWALFGSLVNKAFKEGPVWRRTQYCVLEQRGLSQESGELELVKAGDRSYCMCQETKRERDKLLEALNNGRPIYKAYMRTGLPWAVACKVSIHDAMLLILQGYKVMEYKPLELVVIEHWPLEEEDWKSKLIQGVPVALSALNLTFLSGTATLIWIFLDVSYHVWMPYFEILSKLLSYALHLWLDFLPFFSLRYAVFLPLSWIWPDMMPCNPYTVKLEFRMQDDRKLDMILIKRGFWTDVETLDLFESVSDIQVKHYPREVGENFTTYSTCFDCRFRVTAKDELKISIRCRFKRLTFGRWGKVDFSVSLDDYDRIMTSLERSMNASINFVQKLTKVSENTVHIHTWNHIDLMDTVLEPFFVKEVRFRRKMKAFIG